MDDVHVATLLSSNCALLIHLRYMYNYFIITHAVKTHTFMMERYLEDSGDLKR